MGEYGGASAIVFKGVREIARAWGLRGPETDLSQAFIERAGASDLDDLLEGLVMGRYQLSAGDAPLVFEIARQGDEVAQGVIHWAALGLADLVKGVARQLQIEENEFEVVLIGSTFKGGPMLLDPMKAEIRELAPKARFVRLEAPPVVGLRWLVLSFWGWSRPGWMAARIDSNSSRPRKRSSNSWMSEVGLTDGQSKNNRVYP
jgi:hypothetical protein